MREMKALPVLVLIAVIAAPTAFAEDPGTAPTRPADRFRGTIQQRPTVPGVYVEQLPVGARTIQPAATSVAGFVGATAQGPMDSPKLVTSLAAYQQQFGGPDADGPVGYAVRLFFDNGGSRAWVVRTDPAALPGDATNSTGIYALGDADTLNVLCIPEVSDPAVLTAAEQYCRQRRAFLIIDPPAGADSSAAIAAWLQSPGGPPRTPNCATYFPWLKVQDAAGSQTLRECGPSGAVAGIFARTDDARGVWKAPAGTEADLRGVHSLSHALTNADAAELNPRGINALRELPGLGMVAWGARTLSNDPEWRYVPVRRTALMIEENIDAGTRWVVHEPNAEPTWANVRAQVEAFMHDLWRKGALQGTRPSDAYFVRCDATTTTTADITLGRLNILVGFAPTRPAEFVILTIRQQAATP
ncbi:MAG: phage tail sheath C-terminal domain-containing protein [Armatimonadota bacterium]|jgi:phage tail sheath protein FI